MDSPERKQRAKHWFYGDKVVDLAERNSDEFPLGLLARSVPNGVKRLEFKDEITDGSTGEQVKRTLVISANVDTDLPSFVDLDVQKALLAQSHRQNRYEFPERVEFTIYGLLKLMRKKNESQHIRRVAKSLDNWNGVRFKYSHWWTGDSWDHPKAFVLLQDYDLSRRGNGARSPETPQVFTWSRHFVESIRNSKYKPFDSEFYFSLKKPTTKRMFCFLDKRLHSNGYYRNSDLADFSQHKIGLTKRRESQYPQKLREAYDELVSRGFLGNVSEKKRFGEEGDYFFFCKRGKGEKSRSQVAAPLSLVVDNEENAALEVELEKRGVEKGSRKHQSSGLVAGFDEKLILENCERYDLLVEEQCEVAPGLLVSAIKNKDLIRIPKGKATASQKAKKKELELELATCKEQFERANKVWMDLIREAPIKIFFGYDAVQQEAIFDSAANYVPVRSVNKYKKSEKLESLALREDIIRECFRVIHRKSKERVGVAEELQAWYERVDEHVKQLKEEPEWKVVEEAKCALDIARRAYDQLN